MTSNSSPVESSHVELAEELRSAVSLFVRTIRFETKTPSSAQSEALELLDRFGAASIASLAHRRNVKHQSMRRTLGQLEEDGLARREPDPDDGRSQLYFVTEDGRAWLARSRRMRVARIAELIEQKLADGDREHLRIAIRLLHRLIESNEDMKPRRVRQKAA